MREVLKTLQDHGLAKLAAHFERPVSDPKLLRSLRLRAEAFEFNGQAMPCQLVPELTYDLGSRRVNSQLFMSIIDTPKCKELLGVISRKLGYAPTPENTGAAIIMERSFAHSVSDILGKPAWRFEEFLVVIRLDAGTLVSQHLLTPSTMKSIVVPSSAKVPTKEGIEQYSTVIPEASDLIRGLNDAAVAWNGKQWGLVEFAAEGNIIVGNRTVGLGKFGQFRRTDLGQALRIGMAEWHVEHTDESSGLVIPSPGSSPNRPGFRDWIMTAGDIPTVQTSTGGGYGGGGGAGNTSTVQTGSPYSGSGACSAEYTSRDACYACCDTQGSQVLATGLSITTVVTGAGVAAAAPSVIGAVIAGLVLGIIGVVGSFVVAYVAADACKSACSNTISSSGGGGATHGDDGEWIT